MKYNDFGIDFKYLLVNERDKKFGLTVKTVGFQPVPAHTSYPSTRHPENYYFNPARGRVLSEYQILYISKGKGEYSSQTIKKKEVKKGEIILLFPGQWHTYCPSPETGWNEYYIGFEGPIIDHIFTNGFISPDNPILDIGVNEEIVNLFSMAIQVAKEDKKAAQQFLAGIVFHIIGMMLSVAQNKNFEVTSVPLKLGRY